MVLNTAQRYMFDIVSANSLDINFQTIFLNAAFQYNGLFLIIEYCIVLLLIICIIIFWEQINFFIINNLAYWADPHY